MKTEDICENRHTGNAESVRANPVESSKTKDRYRVHEIILSRNGITSKGIAEIMDRPLNCISGRISELKRMGEVEAIGRENGCAILHATQSNRLLWT